MIGEWQVLHFLSIRKRHAERRVPDTIGNKGYVHGQIAAYSEAFDFVKKIIMPRHEVKRRLREIASRHTKSELIRLVNAAHTQLIHCDRKEAMAFLERILLKESK